VLGLVLPMLLTLGSAFRVRTFTIDDAFISFRYAENLAHGHGLVYNLGERVEGYTNFLWTLLLGLFAALGMRPEPVAKVLGLACACAALVPIYLLSQRLRPLRWAPCIATWLCASSFMFSGYAVFGLETPLFVLLVLTGTEMFFREGEREDIRPWSGLVFALAALTRPEAPLFLLLLYIWKDERLFTKKSLIRGALFLTPVLLHLAFRRLYYGAFVPNTLSAKTGDITTQLQGGADYLQRWALHAGPHLFLALGSVALCIVHRKREGLALAGIAFAFGEYVLLAGGDWMPYFRFLAPAEPFVFLLVDHAARTIAERRERAAPVAIGIFALVMGIHRGHALVQAQRDILEKDKAFWDDAAGRTAEWFVANAEPGPIVIADIGYVGYRTGFPIVDMLGLLSPEIAHLPGGYTRKVGDGYTDAIFAKNPRYFLIISGTQDCRSPSVPSSRAAYGDPRFKQDFRLRQAIKLKGGAAWCVFERGSK
jgi:hypothetical protein